MTAAAHKADFKIYEADIIDPPPATDGPDNTAQVHPFPPPNTPSNTQDATKKPLLKLAVFGVILALAVGGIVVGKKMLAPKGQSLAALEEGGQPGASLTTLTARLNTLEADLADLKIKGGEGVALLQNDVHGLASQLTALGTQAAELQPLAAGIERDHANINEHGRRLAALERVEQDRKARAAERVAVETRAKVEAPTLPFRAMSIDLWGGKPYVAIVLPDRRDVEMVAPGDRKLGWEVVAIDNRTGQVLFKDEQGRTVQKTVEEH